jgi:hypothetical protein
MSANNWRVCPACLRKAKANREELARNALAAYGKVPPDEYQAMSAEALKPVKLEETLREDYELGISEGGEFYVTYWGDCADCPFEFTYRHKEQVLRADAGA